MSEENIIRSPYAAIDIPNISVGEYLYKKLQLVADRPILVEEKTNESLTGNQLIAEANMVAMALLRSGIQKSDIICCYSGNNLSYVKVKFAAYFLGVTLDNSSPMNKVHELENQLNITEASYLFTTDAKMPNVQKLLAKNSVKQPKLIVVLDSNTRHQNYITFDDFIKVGKSENIFADKIPYFEINPKENIAEILYTSGTTGVSKAAMISNYSFVAAIETYPPIDKQSVAIVYHSIAHSNPTLMIPSLLSRGIRVILIEKFDEEYVLAAIEKFRATCLWLTPSFGYRLADSIIGDNYDLSSLNELFTGGTHFSNAAAINLINKFGITFRHFYGCTEYFSLTWNTSNQYISGNCGQITRNAELKVVDIDTGNNFEANKDGEICVRGPTLFTGYMKNESATKETIDNNGWLRTGDIGHYDENGNIFIKDRMKELIKYGMDAVVPADIEQFLLQNKAVHNVVVVGVASKPGIWLPRAYVSLNPGISVTGDELQNSVKNSLMWRNELRGGVIFVDDLVKTVSGKVDRNYYKNLANK